VAKRVVDPATGEEKRDPVSGPKDMRTPIPKKETVSGEKEQKGAAQLA